MLVAFSVTPLGVGEDVGEAVAEAVRVVRDSGLPNETDAMFTILEGDWDEAMDVVKRAVEAVAARAPRVSLVLKADLRPGRDRCAHGQSGDGGAVPGRMTAPAGQGTQIRAPASGDAVQDTPSRRSTAVTAAAASTMTRNGALRQASTPPASTPAGRA